MSLWIGPLLMPKAFIFNRSSFFALVMKMYNKENREEEGGRGEETKKRRHDDEEEVIKKICHGRGKN